jgi:hypothetical protein
MSKSNTFETQLLSALLESTTLSALGSVALGASVYLAAYTADPGEAGSAVTNEATFTGYARVALPRDTATWTVTGPTATNDIDATFPVCTGGSNTLSHWAIVNTSAGAGTILYSGTLKASGIDTTRVISNGIQLKILATDLEITED